MAERNDNGQFKKGTSGNPGGRPKTVKEARTKAQEMGVKVLEIFFDIVQDPSQGNTARIQAGTAIMLRAWGKPQSAQEITLEDHKPSDTIMEWVEVSTRQDLDPVLREALEASDGD